MALEDLLSGLVGLASLTGEARGGLSGLASALDGLGSNSKAATSGLTKLGDAGKGAAGAIEGLGGVVKTLASAELPSAKQAAAMVGDALGSTLTSGADAAAGALAKLGPEGEAAGAALQGFAAVLSATIGLLTQFMGLAIEGAQKADLMRDRFAALAGGAAGGKAVQVMLSNLNLPFATSEVNAWAQALLGAGVKGKQLEADVKAIAAATALMGEAGGAAAETLFKRLGEGGPAADKLLKTFQDGGPKADKLLKEMGLSLADLGGQAALAKMTSEQLHEAIAKAMQKKGENPLKDMALTLPAILQKAREGFLSLFNGAGPAVKAFMQAVQKLFGEFNKGSPLIKTLKPIVTDVLSALFSMATKAVTAIHGIFTWLMNGAKAGGIFSGVITAAKSTWSTLVTIFKVVQTALTPIIALFKGLLANAMVMKGIKTIFTVIAVVIGAVVATLATLVAAFAVVAAGIAAFVGLVVGAISGVVGEVASFVESIIDALSGLGPGASGAASNFVGGLVEGIKAGIGAVVGAVGGLASAALGAFTGPLGIHSHSDVMIEHGDENIGGALAEGLDKGQGKAKAASARMAEAVQPGGGKGGAQGRDGGGEVHKHYHYSGPVEHYPTFREHMKRFLAEIAGEAGAQPQGT